MSGSHLYWLVRGLVGEKSMSQHRSEAFCLQMSTHNGVHFPLRDVLFDAGDHLHRAARIHVEKRAFRSLRERLQTNK